MSLVQASMRACLHILLCLLASKSSSQTIPIRCLEGYLSDSPAMSVQTVTRGLTRRLSVKWWCRITTL